MPKETRNMIYRKVVRETRKRLYCESDDYQGRVDHPPKKRKKILYRSIITKILSQEVQKLRQAQQAITLWQWYEKLLKKQ